MTVGVIGAEEALNEIPAALRNPLLAHFRQIERNYRERRWEPAELNGGKFCEVVYSILVGKITGKYPPRPSKPRNFLDSCRKLENRNNGVNRGLRIQIPRVLIVLYEIRNNRNVGHVGGDVDPNEMDATFVLHCVQWVMAELVRVFHTCDLLEASSVVTALTERTLPLIWQDGEVKRILDPSLSHKAQTLALLYSCSGRVAVDLLLRWTEYKNPSRYKKQILEALHRERMIEFDPRHGTALLTPRGAKFVEDTIALRR